MTAFGAESMGFAPAAALVLIGTVFYPALSAFAAEEENAATLAYKYSEEPLPAGRSIWRHNSSATYLVADGNKRTFYYQAPRWTLIEAGVKGGTLLFEGTSDGDQYAGTSYLFSKHCGPIKYEVKGYASEDKRRVILTGKAPVRNSSCQTVATRSETLVFDFVFRAPNDENALLPSSQLRGSDVRSSILDAPKENFDLIVQLSRPSNSQVNSSLLRSISNDSYHLSTCYYGAPISSSDEQAGYFIANYFHIAEFYAHTRAELKVLGVPETVWQEPLRRLVIGYLDELIRRRRSGISLSDYGDVHRPVAPLEKELVTALEDYRNKSNPALPEPFSPGIYCGGDFFGQFKVKLVPDTGKIWFIRGFDFDWCKKLDRASPEKCGLWERVLPSSTLPFGTYYYRAEWSDGTKDSDFISVVDVKQDGKAIPIKKP